MVTVFLRGLSSRLGAGDTIAAQVREDFRKGLRVKQGSETLHYNRAIRHCDRDLHVMYASTFVAGDGNAIVLYIGSGCVSDRKF
jgi:hypothetical protein